jgi:Bifunctional DNA primase/polymerase, N-terminal
MQTIDAQPALDLAWSYLDRGWALIPIQGLDKGPNFAVLKAVYGRTDWKHLARRPADPEQVRGWYELDPNTNIGIITGRPSGGLVVADWDLPSAPPLLETPTVRTGSGGAHLYLEGDRSTASRKTPFGDLKADGGYVVAPLSRHATGASYRWLIPVMACEPLSVRDVWDDLSTEQIYLDRGGNNTGAR